MGIDISCSKCPSFEGKQIFSYRRQLLDALRKYLSVNKETHEKELKYINWFYREEDDDNERVLTITEEEKTEAKKLLNEKDLDGLFCWTFLDQEDIITPYQAGRFLKTFKKIQPYFNEKFLDLNILTHCYYKNHNLQCW